MSTWTLLVIKLFDEKKKKKKYDIELILWLNLILFNGG
jgi:hypothetical protein